MDSDAEGVPSEFFDYFKVAYGYILCGFYFSHIENMKQHYHFCVLIPLFLSYVFRFYAFKGS